MHHRYKIRLNTVSDKKFIHHIILCCALSHSMKNLKVLASKILSVLQAQISLGISLHSFAAAYLKVDWPLAVCLLGDEVPYYF